jgi:hypothetical protein
MRASPKRNARRPANDFLLDEPVLALCKLHDKMPSSMAVWMKLKNPSLRGLRLNSKAFRASSMNDTLSGTERSSMYARGDLYLGSSNQSE